MTATLAVVIAVVGAAILATVVRDLVDMRAEDRRAARFGRTVPAVSRAVRVTRRPRPVVVAYAATVAATAMLATYVVGELAGRTVDAAPAYAATSTRTAPTVGTVETADRDHGARRVTYVEWVAPRRFYVETADGAAHVLARCVAEDDRRPCVWDARRRGNGAGRSTAYLPWIDHAATIRPRLMRAAYRGRDY